MAGGEESEEKHIMPEIRLPGETGKIEKLIHSIMFLYHKLLSCILFCLIVIFMRPANAVDYPGPYRPYSESLKINKIDLTGLDEAAYVSMSLDDIRLKNAYISIFLSSIGGNFDHLEPEIVEALANMRKRGESVSPLLLKLMNENQETLFETMVLSSIDAVGTIQLETYLEYARKVLRERTQSMSAVLAACASNLLAEHGTKEDAKLMKWVMETRPWVADSVTRKLDELNRRLGLPKQGTRPPLRDATLRDGKVDWNARRTPQRPPLTTDVKQQESASSLVYGLLILVSSTLIWLVVKNRKKST